MPSFIKYWSVTARTPVRIVEVNPLRETLSVMNCESHFLALMDDDEPMLAASDCHGIPIHAFEIVTLSKADGDSPDRAWWIYGESTQVSEIVVIEGVKERLPGDC